MRLQALVLLIARNVAEHRQRLQAREETRNPQRQLGGVGILEAVLELRPADAVFDGQVLHRLHEERDALDAGQLRLQPPDDVARVDPALLERPSY